MDSPGRNRWRCLADGMTPSELISVPIMIREYLGDDRCGLTAPAPSSWVRKLLVRIVIHVARVRPMKPTTSPIDVTRDNAPANAVKSARPRGWRESLMRPAPSAAMTAPPATAPAEIATIGASPAAAANMPIRMARVDAINIREALIM